MFRKPSVRARLLVGAMILLVPAVAQATDINGAVSEASGTRTLEGAQVTIVELGRITEADSSGRFHFGDVAPGTYTLRAQFAGVPAVEVQVVVPESGTIEQDIVLGNLGNDILVVGQVANILNSMTRQRSADGVESVLTRDSVGQFPDQNVAESLRRLPGVNILNDQGEGRFVSIRGLDPELNSASVNGTRLPAPESDVRSVALDVISADTIESIEVKKSLTPDMDADTIGGSIEINTVSAFARKKDLLTLTAEGSYNNLRDTVTPKLGFDFSKRISDNFGIAGGVSYYQRKFATNNMESEGWNLTDDGVLFADTLQYRDYDVERKRFNATLSLDFRPSDTTTLYARGLYSKFDDQEYRRQLSFEMDEDPRAGDMHSAEFSAEDGEIAVQRSLKDRFESQKVQSITLGGETKTEGWKLNYAGSWSRSSEEEHGSLDPAEFERKFEDEDFGVLFDYANPRRTHYTITSGEAMFSDPAEYSFNKLERTTLSDSVDTEWAAHADLAKTFAMDGGELTIQGGAKARWRKKRYNANIDVFESDDLMMDQGDLLGPQDYDLAYIEPALAKIRFRDFFNSHPELFELNEEDSFASSHDSDYGVREDVTAGYLLGRWDSPTLRVIGGVRMEHTYNDIRGQELGIADDFEDWALTPLKFTRSYTDWLPSLTARFEPKNGLVFRAAGYRSLVRPKFSAMAPRVVIEDNEGEFGNPDLQPYKAWSFDASAEYYFSKNGGISLGYFHKNIKNYIVERTFEDYEYNGQTLDEATIPFNGDSARINGIEFSYNQVYDFLPGFLSGLLTQLNYTFTDAKGTVLEDGDIGDPRRIPLPSAARSTFNVVVGYEKGPLSLRVAGTYRDKYLDELGDAADEDRYVDQHFQLDISAKYWATKNIQVFGDLINLTNAPYFAYQNFEDGKRLLQYENYKFTGKFGVKLKF